MTAGGTSPERLDDATARTVGVQLPRRPQHDPGAAAAARRSTPTPAETATRLDRENEIFDRMVAGAAAVHPTKKTPAVALTRLARRLATPRSPRASTTPTISGRRAANARFVEPAYKGVEPIADKMNDWILEQGTRTETCNTDALQAEVVNGPRKYGPQADRRGWQ